MPDALTMEALEIPPERAVPLPVLRDGVALMREGLTAFAARVALARAATRTLDLQYYAWHGDLTGGLLAREALRAAERGVRVRMLLDDMYAMGRERMLAAFDTHPNIEVRLFNATRWRLLGPPGMLLEMLFGGWHLDRRMHNKAWIMDGEAAILGGRNIGDEYFDASEHVNFRDLDLAVVGRAAVQTQSVFERYWKHKLSRPLSKVSNLSLRPRALKRMAAWLDDACAAPQARPFFDRLGEHTAMAGVLSDEETSRFIATRRVRVVADPPEKAQGEAPGAACLAPTILHALRGAEREALIISPYFVPGRVGTRLLEGLARRGVRVSVVTNSLAATDVVAVHGGYAKYRDRLLRAGIELHELMPTGEEGVSVFGSRGASLHSKAVMIDGRTGFVGSFNMDPRSAALNTEMGAFVDEPILAAQLAEEHERLRDPTRSWRVSLDAGRLCWNGAPYGQPAVLRCEPEASIKRRAMARLTRWLPVEKKL
ncbi:phospholipase D family protein [Rhodovarius crocodyli]|uniref:Phospholipase D n=1 Tax=Rhodovarius crocodyli TaxID=1979269 RepID=A0A437LXH3_9PROT|nr:phospholipase D family protein [Rhodovarius crocodyli]RVT90089.1 phospholipase D family protein [Rhodovarius crocodyli]